MQIGAGIYIEAVLCWCDTPKRDSAQCAPWQISMIIHWIRWWRQPAVQSLPMPPLWHQHCTKGPQGPCQTMLIPEHGEKTWQCTISNETNLAYASNPRAHSMAKLFANEINTSTEHETSQKRSRTMSKLKNHPPPSLHCEVPAANPTGRCTSFQPCTWSTETGNVLKNPKTKRWDVTSAQKVRMGGQFRS